MKNAPTRILCNMFIMCVLFTAFYKPAYSEEPGLNLSFGMQCLNGNSTYKVGFSSLPALQNDLKGFPISKLTFPLNVYCFSTIADLAFNRWQINVVFTKNLTHYAGIMKDYDWRYKNGIAFPSDYSENKTKIHAFLVNGSIGYKFFHKANWSFGGGIGYWFQNFEFTTTNNFQRSWDSSMDMDEFTVEGPFIDYDIEYSIPYIQGKIIYTIGEFVTLAAGFGYSPLVTIKDYDHHIHREIESLGRSDGNAYLCSAQANMHIYNKVILSTEGTFVMIDTKGFFIDRDASGIHYDETIESKQFTLRILIGYQF